MTVFVDDVFIQATVPNGPGSPQLSRTDSAMAWRATLAQRTSQAARLLWWELPDGTVELGKAALHDDTTLPALPRHWLTLLDLVRRSDVGNTACNFCARQASFK